MAIFELEHFGFTYAGETKPAIHDISLSVSEGEFLLLCGLSGCGKTTLLRQLKPAIAPRGSRSGAIRFCGQPLKDAPFRKQAEEIGFVMQSPEEQAVTDKVWHELAFGLENLGLENRTIRLRTAEMASFFGIEAWFEKDVSSLSGGQKQLLNLAAVMAMQPKVLLLDEPTSQLDPIAAADFLAAVKKINAELGVAVVIVEQRLQEVFPLADRVAILDKGSLLLCDTPREAGLALIRAGHPMAQALPSAMRIAGALGGPDPLPLTVREGRQWLRAFLPTVPPKQNLRETGTVVRDFPAIVLKDCWFSYEKGGTDVIRDLSLQIPKQKLFCILGGNGTGKTTALRLMAGLKKPYRGKVRVEGKIAVLPQNPQTLFVKSTVAADLEEAAGKNMQGKINEAAELTGLTALLHRHPYDLSGGEQQRAALAKVLLTQPEILLMDEPTKGLDSHFKIQFAEILRTLLRQGVTVVMVSHDIEFCAEYADFCALFFNGAIAAQGEARRFFAGNSFYTTAANRIAREWFPQAVTNGDVVEQCKKE